jgi:16S rRNA (cytidine1402-2'-O)-methyltransferase
LGDTAPLEVMPISVKKTMESLRCFVFEKEKAGRAFVKSISPNIPQDNIKVHLLNKFTEEDELNAMLLPLLDGEDIGLITDAGCPGVADPGAALVALAHTNNIRVIPLVGPSSILLAVMAAGLNGQSFAFNGYLPIDKSERRKAIKQFEKKSIELDQTQLFIETPYRNSALLEELSKVLRPKTLVSVACDITLPTEFIKTATAEAWRKNKEDLHKRPTVFSLLGG